MRGTGDGHRPYDMGPNSSMTNGTVEQAGAVTGAQGRTLSVKYKDGEQRIVVPPQVPIVTFEPGRRDDLKAGAHVVMFVRADAQSQEYARLIEATMGDVVGKPIAVLLMRHEATVMSCNKFTVGLPELARSADVLVAAERLRARTLLHPPAHGPQAAGVTEALARARLAQRLGDRATAKRWARAVLVLWRDADPFLHPKRAVELMQKKHYGKYADPKLGTVPVTSTSTIIARITGGGVRRRRPRDPHAARAPARALIPFDRADAPYQPRDIV